MVPRAREDGLVVQELSEETLVYDLKRHRAHCLNRPAALIWQHCDGQTTVADLAGVLQRELKAPVDEAVVWFALDRLGKARLLREQGTPPAGGPLLSRREVVRKLALVGGLTVILPAVTSIVAPTVAYAVSGCTNAQCKAGSVPGCGGCLDLPCTDQPGKTCRNLGAKCGCLA